MKKTLLLSLGCAVAMSASALTYNVTVPAGTQACYIAGDMTEWLFMEMQQVDALHYTIDLPEATEADGYKYSSGPDWSYVEKGADGSELGNRTYSESDVVVNWAAIYNPNPGNGLVYTVTVPEGTKACYIAGDMTGWLHQEMERIDDTHYTITMGDATEADGYKYCSGPGWAYEELTAEGTSVNNRTYTPSDVVVRWAMVYEPEEQAGDIHFTVTVPAGTTECFIVGSFQGWSTDDAVAMTDNGDGTFSYTLTDVVDVQYKYWNGYAWEGYDGNRTASVSISTEVNDVISNWNILDAVQKIQNDGLKVWTKAGAAVVEADAACTLPIYTTNGVLVKAVKVKSGTMEIALPKGIYLLGDKKVAVY